MTDAPQYRLASVPASEVVTGDVLSWNLRGCARLCRVRHTCPALDKSGRVVLVIEDPDFETGVVHILDPDTTVSRLEAL